MIIISASAQAGTINLTYEQVGQTVKVHDGADGAITIESDPENGTADVVDGYVVYTPTTMLREEDTFTYSVEGAEGTATVAAEYSGAILYQEDFADDHSGRLQSTPLLPVQRWKSSEDR